MIARVRAILTIRPFWTVAYFAHASVLPVNETQGSQSLGEMGRKVCLILSADRLAWWALWLIWGIMVHRLNHGAFSTTIFLMRRRILVIGGSGLMLVPPQIVFARAAPHLSPRRPAALTLPAPARPGHPGLTATM
jgi:hypothetical protein